MFSTKNIATSRAFQIKQANFILSQLPLSTFEKINKKDNELVKTEKLSTQQFLNHTLPKECPKLSKKDIALVIKNFLTAATEQEKKDQKGSLEYKKAYLMIKSHNYYVPTNETKSLEQLEGMLYNHVCNNVSKECPDLTFEELFRLKTVLKLGYTDAATKHIYNQFWNK